MLCHVVLPVHRKLMKFTPITLFVYFEFIKVKSSKVKLKSYQYAPINYNMTYHGQIDSQKYIIYM